jgi:hypothetical protein
VFTEPLLSSGYTGHNIIVQHSAALVNDLIFEGSLECAASCHVHRLLVFYVATILEVTQYHVIQNIDPRHNTTALLHNTTPHITQESTECQKHEVPSEKEYILTKFNNNHN